ncbi:MFS general substrate transporter [Mycena sanguinolenta]|nr:MFS general substrate transporter [Mycena sanguinolenta]
MASEDTPLLASDAELARNLLYDRFPPSQKRVIVALVSCSAFLPMFASGCFIPSIPQIAIDLNSTGSIVSFSVSLSIFGSALGSMVFATYSGYYGRRPMYLFGLPLLCFGSIGVAIAKTISELMVFRFIQALGTSGGLALALFGNTIAPTIGGGAPFSKYSSWRNVQFGLAFVGLFVFLAMLALLPETSHPGTLGMDKSEECDSTHESPRKFKWVWLNPFSCLWLLRSPNLLLVVFSRLVQLVPIAYTLGARYNIKNEAIIGACFLPMGFGNLIGSPLAGMLSDRTVIKWRERRGGKWVPEDRLRGTLFAAATLLPLSVVLCGVITHFVPGPLGLALNLVCFFLNGLGVDLVLAPSGAYSVDIMHSRSSEILAANAGLRSFLLSIAVSGILPFINLYGVLITHIAVGIIAWGGFVLLWLTIKYGDKMRAWIDVGYSTIETT